jgi:hypothetical protein
VGKGGGDDQAIGWVAVKIVGQGFTRITTSASSGSTVITSGAAAWRSQGSKG